MYKLSIEYLNAISDYLVRKPFKEVYQFLNYIELVKSGGENKFTEGFIDSLLFYLEAQPYIEVAGFILNIKQNIEVLKDESQKDSTKLESVSLES